MRANFADALERIAELEQAVADHIKLQGIQFEKGVNEGMERAAVMPLQAPKLSNAVHGYTCGFNDGWYAYAEAIRKEIDNG